MRLARASPIARARVASRTASRRAVKRCAPARSKSLDEDEFDDERDGASRMTFDDGRPLIDVSTAVSKASVKRSSSIGPPVARPNVMKSRAATLAALDAARRDVDDAEENDGARRRRERRDREREGRKKGETSLDPSDARKMVEWMARSTDEMLDDLEAREAPEAVAAWKLSKGAERVVENPAVRATVDVVGKVGAAAVKTAAPIVLDGAGKVMKEGSKLAVRAAVSAAAAKKDGAKKGSEGGRDRRTSGTNGASGSSSASSGGMFGGLGLGKKQPVEPEKPKPFAAIEAALRKTKKPEPPAPKKTGLFNFGSSNASENEDNKKKRGGGGGGGGFFR
jgi:hypothetical protein